MKRTWWHVVKHVLFGLHSPTLLVFGQCWCQRNQPPPSPMSQQEAQECIERSYLRNWGGME